MKKYLDIIDPIHGFIQVSKSELPLVDSPLFQRLRRIKQLSCAFTVYPTALHTRFEHSLGVMYIAGQAGQALYEKGAIKSDEIDILRLAGLLHDIGHGPFSHIFEEVSRTPKTTHEDFGRRLILESDIGDSLQNSGFDKRLVADVAFSRSQFKYLNEIISGSLSADMMDYLLRDSYFTGTEHARIDYKRITHSLDVHQRHLALDQSALYSFESMVYSRYQMFKAVYFHKTVRAAEVMLIEALKLSDDEFGFTTFDPDEFLDLTDEQALIMIASSKSPNLGRARRIVEDFKNRRLIKCVFERIHTGSTDTEMNTDDIRAEISRRTQIDEDEIFVDSAAASSLPTMPSDSMHQSILLMTRRGEQSSGREVLVSDMPIVSAISGYMNILRVYTYPQNRKKVEIAAGSILKDLK